MKKKLLVLVVLALALSLAAGALAAPPVTFPPSYLDLKWDDGVSPPFYTVLSVQVVGTDKKRKFYQLTGVCFNTPSLGWWLPVSGSGYMYQGDLGVQWLAFSLSGDNPSAYTGDISKQLRGMLNANGTGSAYMRSNDINGAWGPWVQYSITIVPPMLTLP